ncbi:MAG: protein kinase family protein [Planctomycetota bacterium]|nr:protein kinase family protein [Planctomycetota bacterium]
MSEARSLDDTTDNRAGVDIDPSDPFDRLAEEFADRCRRGDAPSIAEYETRYPEHAERIRKLLPTVAMMEQLKRGTQSTQEFHAIRPMPERLGEFRVLRELGRGGMGVVYEAVQESLGRHVALKVVPYVHLDARKLQRFQREAEAVAQLHHTNIVPIFAVGEHEGLPYYAMQYIRGNGLDVLLGRWREGKSARRDDRARVIARIGKQAAEALQYAHDQGVLHRDIKPANLLMDEQQTVWITDFGLAKLAGLEDLTASGDVIGTLRYLAPEALRGETGPRSDVYSLGLTLYELLTLSAPFGDLTPSELLRQVGEGQLPRPRRLDPTIPGDLETIVLKATAREPDHRYATAGALADDLRCFLEDRPIQARRATAVERAWRWSRRNRLTAALFATAAASVMFAAVVGWVGYASTKTALSGESIRRHEAEAATKRADENVALSLEVFAELFNKLSPRGDPFPPPTGRAQPPRDPASGRRPGPLPDGSTGRRPLPALSQGVRNPFAKSSAPQGEPDGPPRRGGSQDNAVLLQSILTFYDRFARRNEAEPRLQGEAAWAYFKVGLLYEHLGRARDAEEAISHASGMLEDLIKRFPSVAGYRSKLVEIIIMVEPWSADPAALQRLEDRLLRARAIIDGLVAESPENPAYIEAQIHVYAKLGVVFQRRNRPDEAEASYRRAIAITGARLERSPADDRARTDRADIREDLAALQLDHGRRDEAKQLLEEAEGDLTSLGKDMSSDLSIADRYLLLAEDFRRLGKDEHAVELSRRAEEIRAMPRPQVRGLGSPR